jgi:hypothetical protein
MLLAFSQCIHNLGIQTACSVINSTERSNMKIQSISRRLRPLYLSMVLALIYLGHATATFAATVNFDADGVGAEPTGWKCGVTKSGLAKLMDKNAVKWTVDADATAPSKSNVLKQTGYGAFPWCVNSGTVIADGFVEVKFKPLAGKEDQAGGVVWRWKDEGNYYVARANALENNVSLYYTQDGSRKTIKYVDAPVAALQWHTLRVEFQGKKIKVLLDGQPYIEHDDSHIAGPGSVGVWTKADSETAFDDFSFGSLTAR